MNAPRIETIAPETYRVWFEHHFPVLRHRSPFHHPAWLEAVGTSGQLEVVYLGVYDGNELTAVVPGFLARRGFVRLFGSPLRGTMTSYLGPVGLDISTRSEDLVELVASCSRYARRRWGVLYTRFTLRDAPPPEFRPALGPEWERQRSRSYRLDLRRGEAAIWDGLESDCRRNIRRAQRVGIETVPLDDARLFFQILDSTLRRHQTTSWHPERFFERMISELVPRDRLWAWGARYEGEIIAAGLFLHDDREVHFVSGASRPRWGNLPTSYLLHWHAIQTGIAAGLQVFNSDISRVPSIDRFKASFRPALERRYSLIWAPGLVRQAERVAVSSYAHLRRIRAQLNRRAAEPELVESGQQR